MLRESEARDRAAFIELPASPQVHTYLGVPRRRDELERTVPEVPERWPGASSSVSAGRWPATSCSGGRRRTIGPRPWGKVELGYLFLPRAWGFG